MLVSPHSAASGRGLDFIYDVERPSMRLWIGPSSIILKIGLQALSRVQLYSTFHSAEDAG